MTSRKLILLLLIVIGMASCSDEAIYDEFIRVPESGWPADSAVNFEVVINDTTASYAVFVRIRHNPDYPYQNLYLFRTILSGEEQIYTDKINYQVAKPTGEWLGDGFGALKTIEAPYSRNTLRFNQRGTYRFRFAQGMREELLHGVEEIGLRIVPINNSQDDQ